MSTVENNVLYNMYGQGNVKDTDINTTFISLDKDYIIRCYREKLNPRWVSDIYAGQNYKCHIIFYNNLNIELLHLIMSESEVFKILYNFNSYWPEGVYSIPLGSGYHSTTSLDNEYSFMLDFDYKEYHETQNKISDQRERTVVNDKFYLFVHEYSSIHSQVINKFKIRFDEYKLIDFTDLLFFVFLIDIIDLPEYKSYYDTIYEYL